MEAYVVGVISGLVATALVFFVRHIYKLAIVPWIEDRVYKDARIEGRWHITYPDLPDVEEQATLERTAHRVKGQINCIKGPDAGKIYQVEGTFRNLLLTLTYTAADLSAMDRGAFVMQLNGNGSVFVGRSSYYHDGDHCIVGAESKWNRLGG